MITSLITLLIYIIVIGIILWLCRAAVAESSYAARYNSSSPDQLVGWATISSVRHFSGGGGAGGIG
ncbi:hypothetical protein ACO2JO_14525 [Leptospira interrogans]